MISNGHVVGDGTWDLRIFVTNLQTERLIRVKGDTHMGGVMYKLTQDLEISMDWSDHGLWQPSRNRWVNRVKTTLDQYGIQADALLHFTPMHKTLRVQLPDLRYLDMRVDFSVQTFSAVVGLCKSLGIVHPEELSLCKPLDKEHLRCNYKDYKEKVHSHERNGTPGRRNGHGPPLPPDTNTFIAANSSPEGSNGSLNHPPLLCAPVSPYRTHNNTPNTPNTSHNLSSISMDQMNGSGGSDVDTSILADSAGVEVQEARKSLVRPKSLIEKARMNVAWLDSSLSIMEQGVKEYDSLCLRFKFYVFYDLNPKTDAVRINQIYEQAKWQLLNEEIDCTEEEMLMFAALQLQVNSQAHHPTQRSRHENGGGGNTANGTGAVNEDDIDAALTDLQTTLEGSSLAGSGAGNMGTLGSNGLSGYGHGGDITKEPELFDHLRFLKPKRFTLRAYKKYWITYRDLQLLLYKTRDAMYARSPSSPPLFNISLRGCEVTPDVNIAQGRYGIRLDVPSPDGMTEMYIRCDNEKQYAVWMAACRLASKGRSLADSSYDMEVKSIIDLLELQKPSKSDTPTQIPASQIIPDNYLSPRYARKLKGKADHRILESHTNVRHLSLTDAKLKYIAAWQSLPDYGVSLFVVKFTQNKKEELLGVAHNRIMKLDINTGDNLKTWRYNTLKAWNVNWEVKLMMTQFEEENLLFHVLSADCKVIHEFIGGYIFLSMRSKDANQSLNQELFHKLTGGWT